ncbi:putative bifunctional diguanylate cyclase/phosphodiesterase [Ruminococcus gauvreauii]|uniref:Stage 0 sporulation protein A homolog n=1 Tax=Ruminococcus gauvreauii TaxID=438033 RepID=A0ABY5VGB2_9FIRM|nr:EAL domain-containing response regulator [Ruminococcus gauvreauii]UWP59337.1 EAL domain-containing protein [Ruminococcus gauvreauii]
MEAHRTVLIVEDNLINREILREILASEYQVLEAGDGQEALSILEKQSDKISLILLDIVMPVMDGFTFLSHVKKEPSFASIPVIVTTQSNSEKDEVTALSHGAADFVPKPYRPQIILHRAANIINLRETAAMVNQLQYDRLTGIYNKEYFYKCARDILMQNPGEEYDIICSDIENFKLVNDIFGTSAGDCLLQEISGLYREIIKGAGIYGRIGADQFACMRKRSCRYTDDMFIHFIQRLNARSCAKNVLMKWGIYSVEDRGLPVEKMCDRALLAVRSIKGQYGKYFAFYDDALRDKLLREQSITDEMAAALLQGQFEVYFQPQYRIADGSLAGAEALVRWIHPKWGLQPPSTFIPLFERNGFITRLDQFVWDKVCAVLQKWDNMGYLPISVSVNVSRADIYNIDLADDLLRIVRKYGLTASRIPLEITESAYTENPSQIIETVRSLKRLGFEIEMDDFGSGYSSLNMLNEMPLNVLKLDMRFVQSETAKPKNRSILRYIMEIARFLGLRVVAEGVETNEQLERLRDLGCDYVQGYYFARPMPIEEFEKLIKR